MGSLRKIRSTEKSEKRYAALLHELRRGGRIVLRNRGGRMFGRPIRAVLLRVDGRRVRIPPAEFSALLSVSLIERILETPTHSEWRHVKEENHRDWTIDHGDQTTV